MIYDCCVIGCGPAGITASIYLKRANLNCLIIEKDVPGGQVVKSSLIENYPGFTSISGGDLASYFYKQIKSLDIPVKFAEVVNIADEKDIKSLSLANGEKILCKSVILAIGRSPKKLSDEGDSLLGKGVSYCSFCDGALYKNEDVLVVGGGNSALEESLYLASICKSVSIVNRSETLKGDNILISKVNENKKIKVYLNSVIDSFIKENDKLKQVVIKKENDLLTLDVKACFIFIGYAPDTKFLNNLDILDEKGYIMVDERKETKVKNIYACGDVVKKDAYQITTAVGEGAACAISLIKSL